MHKRHAANKIPNTTACGYECTAQEYRKMHHPMPVYLLVLTA